MEHPLCKLRRHIGPFGLHGLSFLFLVPFIELPVLFRFLPGTSSNYWQTASNQREVPFSASNQREVHFSVAQQTLPLVLVSSPPTHDITPEIARLRYKPELMKLCEIVIQLHAYLTIKILD